MSEHLRYTFVVAALALAALACQIVTSSEQSEPIAPASDILFQDDFSDPGSGWDSLSDSGGMTDYANGGYRILVNEANFDYWANPGRNFTDVRVEVSASRLAGPEENDYGVICRYVDAENFYFFIIGSDGFYAIGKMSGGEQQLVGMEQMNFSRVILQGEATNHIRADCVGSTLTLYVNDEILADVRDEQFSAGDVGLMAGTFDEPGTDIFFDDFFVRRP